MFLIYSNFKDSEVKRDSGFSIRCLKEEPFVISIITLMIIKNRAL